MFITSVAILRFLLLCVFRVARLKKSINYANLSPFECGFIPSTNNRNNFSIQFFLVALIFLIFDVELILLFPLLTNSIFSLHGITAKIFILFLIALTLGLIVEWVQRILEWKAYVEKLMRFVVNKNFEIRLFQVRVFSLKYFQNICIKTLKL